MTTKTVFVIAGPTAVGKTAIAIDVAKRLETSIISADSRQCYREMTIGTAKPSAEELAQVKHYFIDEFPVTQNLTAADYEKLALGYLDEIFKSNDNAVVVGGTGLYIKALCEGLDEMPEVDKEIADKINSEYKDKGIEWLQAAVQEEDPEFYSLGEIQNPSRLIRALIFKRSVGKSIIHYQTKNKKQRPFNIIKVGLDLPREVLYEHINTRVDKMIKAGLLKEAELLFPLRHLKNLQTVGYSELFDYINGTYTLKQSVEKIKQNTRNYAKRQLTWFKKDDEMTWFHANQGAVGKILSLKQV